MKDSLLTTKQKKEILSLIRAKNYSKIVSILEKVKTGHAGTAKTSDKRFVINGLMKSVIKSSKNSEKDFFKIGKIIYSKKVDSAKEIGISLMWRGYRYNTNEVKDYLIKTADDPNWEVREYAGNAFANTVSENEGFYKDVMVLAVHRSENIRRAALFASLGLRRKETLAKGFELMRVLMFDKSKYVRKNLGPFILGSYYGNKFPKETLKKLKSWSGIRDENVRWNIIMAFNNSFGNKYPEDALKILVYFAGDVDLVTRRALKSTLNFLSKRHDRLVNEFMRRHKPVG